MSKSAQETLNVLLNMVKLPRKKMLDDEVVKSRFVTLPVEQQTDELLSLIFCEKKIREERNKFESVIEDLTSGNWQKYRVQMEFLFQRDFNISPPTSEQIETFLKNRADKLELRKDEIRLLNEMIDEQTNQSGVNKVDTLIVNMYGGAGVGKTTTAFAVIAELKRRGANAEYVSEYAKELVYAENFEKLDGSLKNQEIIYAEQKARIDLLNGKAEVIVTDSPLMLNPIYLKESNRDYEKNILEQYNGYNNMNVLLVRDMKLAYEQRGRIHTLEESVAKDGEIMQMLDRCGFAYNICSRDRVNDIADLIMKSAFTNKFDVQNDNVKIKHYELYHGGEKVGETPFLSEAKAFVDEHYNNAYSEIEVYIGADKSNSNRVSAEQNENAFIFKQLPNDKQDRIIMNWVRSVQNNGGDIELTNDDLRQIFSENKRFMYNTNGVLVKSYFGNMPHNQDNLRVVSFSSWSGNYPIDIFKVVKSKIDGINHSSSEDDKIKYCGVKRYAEGKLCSACIKCDDLNYRRIKGLADGVTNKKTTTVR